MKKNYLFILSVVLAIFSSCTKEEKVVEPQEPTRFRGVLEAAVGESSTKAYANDTYKLYWNEDDRIAIFPKTANKQQYYYDGFSGSTDGDFLPVTTGGQTGYSGQAGELDPDAAIYNYAIFRYNKYHSIDYDGTLMVYFPKEQVYNAKGIGVEPVLVSRATDMDLFFKHAAGYLGFYLYGSNVSVSSITLTSNNNEPLSGFPYVSFDDEENPVVHFYGHEKDAPSCTIRYESAIKIGESAEDATAFWITLPPVSLEKGLTLVVKDNNGGEFTLVSNKKREIKRKVFQPFDPIEVIPEIQTIPVESITVDPTNLTLTMTETETATLTAKVLPEDATNPTVTWSSSNPDVATVDGEGHVTAVAAGTATITVTTTDGGKTATCTVTVKEKVYPVETVTLDKEALVLFVGEAAVALTATISPDNATNKNVTWTSSDPNVATVDENGNVTAVAVGTASITVKTEDGNKTDECAVTVKAHVASVSLDKTTLEMFVGGEPVSLTATVSPENASDKSVTWASSAPAVATVENGTITPVAAGSATITVTTTDGEKTATCTVTVKDVITYSLAIDPAENAEVNAGSEFTFKLMLTTTTNGVVGEPVNVAANATWTSSDDAFATIANGVAKGVKEGSVTITAKYTTPDDVEKTLTAPLKVNKNPNQAGDDVPIGGGGNF